MSRKPIALLSLSIVAALALHLRAEHAGVAWQVYLFKPLTTMLVIALAGWAGRPAMSLGDPRTRRQVRWVLAGLVCSLAGDVFLMLPGDRFIPGLVSFLFAHLCYIVAFTTRTRPKFGPSLLFYLVYYVLLVGALAPHVGPLFLPVAVYGLALVGTAWCALEQWRAQPSRATARAAAGGMCFIASDSLLAIGRFIGPVAGGSAGVMLTYVAAQWLIARSLDTGSG
jgi:uncharacterized membrane protein YhhN